MAMIKCPECGKEISDKAEVCPSCGYSLKRKNRNKKIIIGCAVVIMGIGFVWYSNRVTPEEQAQINNVYSVISEIGTVGIGSEKRIEDAEKQFDTLSSKCQRHVKNRNELTNARKTYDKLIVDNLDDRILKIGEVTVDKKKTIDQLSSSYKSLSEDQQKLVKNKDLLEEEIQKVTELRITDVESKIENIGTTVNMDSHDKITSARKAYDNLSEEEKNKISNYDNLQDAEKTYSTIAVKTCEDLIKSIGSVSLESKESIEKAQKAYSALSVEDKKKVSNYELLTTSNSEYRSLEKEEKERQKIMNVGDKITSKKWDIEFKRANITARIVPNNTSGAYVYYYADDNETFVDLVFQIKNIDVEILRINGIVGDCKVDYGDTSVTKNYRLYTSNGSSISAVYDWDGLDALESTTMHVGISMPRECQTNDKPITVHLRLNGQEKIIKVR